ncbi:hypothetical protein CBR_g51785 [Chara braunii]|uniref:Uncharacterized protein n=1 Tax=Chara braunii TaxID=69332 RepID=A0A388M909_CHABU|nr:hypothetical protein CBR_g51785 [Chara braunii]|eukprot:GBG91051.1 hypothetical protein CBR_g51785 [Chara braunii]
MAGMTASNEQQQQRAAVWLSELEDGRRRLQEIVWVMSSPANHPSAVRGGGAQMADWLEDMSQQMLDIIRMMEEGPDPWLDDIIAWEQERDITCRCYDFFREGRAISDSYYCEDCDDDGNSGADNNNNNTNNIISSDNDISSNNNNNNNNNDNDNDNDNNIDSNNDINVMNNNHNTDIVDGDV